MNEQRQWVRCKTRVGVRYAVLPDGLWQQGSTGDLSAGGVRLVTEQPVSAGASVQMAVRLPDRERAVNATAQVRWSEQSDVADRHQQRRFSTSGLEIVEITPTDQEVLSQFVARTLYLL